MHFWCKLQNSTHIDREWQAIFNSHNVYTTYSSQPLQERTTKLACVSISSDIKAWLCLVAGILTLLVTWSIATDMLTTYFAEACKWLSWASKVSLLENLKYETRFRHHHFAIFFSREISNKPGVGHNYDIFTRLSLSAWKCDNQKVAMGYGRMATITNWISEKDNNITTS
jgi:hypothetical protein